ncbi:MAG: hypothetical protein WD512_13265, partial [Candidatus Paceibacterota bacterium]
VDGADGTNGTNGVDGADGIGVDNITTDGYGNITITYTDTTTQVINTLTPRIHFGNSHDNPNTATSIVPLKDWFNAIVDNKTTIIPRINTTYFNITTKEIWTYNGTSWSNPMSIGTHLEESSFAYNYNSVASSSISNIINHTVSKVLEDGESFDVFLCGEIYTNVGLQFKIDDGVTENIIGGVQVETEGSVVQDFSINLKIIRKSPSSYVVNITGMIQYEGLFNLIQEPNKFFTKNITFGSMDTNALLDINIYGVSSQKSPVQSNAVDISNFSVTKNKF